MEKQSSTWTRVWAENQTNKAFVQGLLHFIFANEVSKGISYLGTSSMVTDLSMILIILIVSKYDWNRTAILLWTMWLQKNKEVQPQMKHLAM